MKVLYVEDDLTTLATISQAISFLGHEVKTAPDGEEGLKLFRSFKPDLVLSDIQMPKMDGLKLLETIRKEDPNVLYVMASSLDAPEFTLKALRLRANDYLVKPLILKDLENLLIKYAEIHASRSTDREVVGMIFRRDLGMRIDNRLEIVGKVVDRLMIEAESAINPKERLGVHLGLIEMVTNAIEHGNLAITYDEKSEGMDDYPDGWKKLIAQRQKEFADRRVTIEFKMNSTEMEWVITDQGKGFDWSKVPDPNDPENLLASHGRGIMLSKMQFDEITYEEKGNKVRLTKKVTDPQTLTPIS